MKLTYFDDELNFGDAINKLIFEHFIPDCLNEDDSGVILGIGTILGLINPGARVEKIFVFSSGYGYGDLPDIDSRYRFFCVRGLLTAQALKLDKALAITDGAVLLKGIPLKRPEKKYKWTFIPHRGSLSMYDKWEAMVKRSGGHFVSPVNEPSHVIDEILKSELVIAEAMHAAILADTLRVPWIAIATNNHINRFKWIDWLSGLNMEYKPVIFPRVFSGERIDKAFAKKLGFMPGKYLHKLLALAYRNHQRIFIESKLEKLFLRVTQKEPWLSDSNLLEEKYQQLHEKLMEMKREIEGENNP